MLIDHGADINAVNNFRKTVLITCWFQQLRRGKLRLYKDLITVLTLMLFVIPERLHYMQLSKTQTIFLRLK
jgi:hypothetical protein